MAEEKKDDQLTNFGLLNMDNHLYTCSNLKNIIIRDGAWYIPGTDIPLDQIVVKRCGYYLPCELTHYTKQVYYSSGFLGGPKLQEITKLQGIIGESNDRINSQFCQDPFIQLFNASTNTYVNLINTDLIDLYHNKTICISDTGCTFKRRIGEGEKNFKKNEIISHTFGWKLIEGETQNTRVLQIQSIRDDENHLFSEKEGEKMEQSKGGNFISAPFGSEPGICYIFTVTGASPDLLNKIREYPLCDIIELECSFKAYGERVQGFRHIDELMCFMPYGLTDTKRIFKVWFYDELDSNSFGNLRIKNDQLGIKNKTFKSLQPQKQTEYLRLVNEERMQNLDKISNKLFGSNYDSNQDKFIFFKLYLDLPSIFNRVWIEQQDKTICLFGNELDIMLPLMLPLQEAVNAELTNLKSWLNPDKSIEFHWISVTPANSEKPEGSVHCGIKQKLEYLNKPDI